MKNPGGEAFKTKNKKVFLVREVFPADGCAVSPKGFYEALVEIIYRAWQQQKKQEV